MSDQPPVQYASYPRGEAPNHYGTVEQLRALADGYTGLNYVFVINIVLALGSNSLTRHESPLLWIPILTVLFLVIAGASYPQNKKIGYGLGWSHTKVIVASVLKGLNSALCCGIIGFAVMQNKAIAELRKYGVKKASFQGIKKQEIDELIRNRNMAEPTSSFQNPPQ